MTGQTLGGTRFLLLHGPIDDIPGIAVDNEDNWGPGGILRRLERNSPVATIFPGACGQPIEWRLRYIVSYVALCCTYCLSFIQLV